MAADCNKDSRANQAETPACFLKWRFRRWVWAGAFTRIFKMLSEDPDFEFAMIDGSASDEIVRAGAASLLESLGYEVITAASGTEAISILEKGSRSSFVHWHNRRLDFNRPGYAEKSIVPDGRFDRGWST
jgi:hypothetical protein